MERLLEQCSDLYMVDLVCDPGLAPFYEGLGLVRTTGMSRRIYARQSAEDHGEARD